MADISKEIQDFKDAIYGEEVRGSMISLAEKVNAETEKSTTDVAAQVKIIQTTNTRVNEVAQVADNTVTRANETMDRADVVLDDATEQAEASAGSAKLSESWTHGATGIRSGEDTNNSKYYSRQAETQADISGQEAARSRVEADRAAQYANIVAPGFYVDVETMCLYQKAGVGVDFRIFDDSILYWRVS